MKAPFVFSNLAMSLDGKIAPVSRGFVPLGTAADREFMQKLRKKCDIVLMGASTLKSFRKFCGVRDWLGHPHRQPANGIFSSRLEGLDSDWPFFREPGVRRLLFVSPACPAARIRKFRAVADVIVIPERQPIAKGALSRLKQMGYRNILVEGGGAVMWEFCRLNLIDRYHVTLTPKIVGGDLAPTLVDGKGFEAARILRLRLVAVKKVGNELFLTYGKAT